MSLRLKLFICEGFSGGKKAWWLIDWLHNGFLIISGIRRGVLMTNKLHSINYTISKGIYGRNNQCRAKGERMLFFTETECHEPRVKGALCAFTFLLLYFVPTFIITGDLSHTLGCISQSVPFFCTLRQHGRNKIWAEASQSLVVCPWVLAIFSKRLYLYSKLLSYLLAGPNSREVMPLCVGVGMFLLKLYYRKLELAAWANCGTFKVIFISVFCTCKNQLMKSYRAYFRQRGHALSADFFCREVDNFSCTKYSILGNICKNMSPLLWFSDSQCVGSCHLNLTGKLQNMTTMLLVMFYLKWATIIGRTWFRNFMWKLGLYIFLNKRPADWFLFLSL